MTDASRKPAVPAKLLLASVFGPYGVKDEYAESLGMQMELLNNQITREQGIHSPRVNFWSYPLYFLAENISIPTTVLDFPQWDDFVRELRHGYTHIGISFIQMNHLKARRMAEYVRQHYPDMKIILVGYGTSLPDLATLVPHDAVCHGEGVRWIREYFGENPDAPVRHPVMHGIARMHIYGVPVTVGESAVLFPGMGCTNGCFFCATSNKFNKKYIPFLLTGNHVFDVCREAEETLGVHEFAMIDENFFKSVERARELLSEMEKNRRTYIFTLFASAEILMHLGIDFLVRMGVCAVWVGVETEADVFDKLKDVDIRRLIDNLQAHGISAISSSILFMEHHDRATLQRDIDWAISLGSDIHQFMQLTPLPGTPLYDDYKKRGLLIPDFPHTKRSGQMVLSFNHPHFSSGEATELTRAAFRRKYEIDGSGFMNMGLTALRGYRLAKSTLRENTERGLAWDLETRRYVAKSPCPPDDFLALRVEAMKARALVFRPILLAARLFSPNARTRQKAADVIRLYRETFGPPTIKDRLLSLMVVALAGVEFLRHAAWRLAGKGDFVRQPPMRRLTFRQ